MRQSCSVRHASMLQAADIYIMYCMLQVDDTHSNVASKSELLCAVLRTTVVHNDTHTCEHFLHFCMLVRFRFLFVCLFRFCLFMFFCGNLGNFVLLLLAFVVLGLVSSILCQEIGWEERLLNDLFCVELDVKPQSISQ